MIKGTAELQRPVPLYMQVVRQLRAQIASGELAEGDRIPSQREMMQIWRISMQTASKVIGALKTEGLAIPSIGRDTIVAPGAPARIAAAAAAGTAQGSAEPPADASYDVTAKAELTACPADVAEVFGIPSGRRALRRHETSFDNGTAVKVTVTWFPQTIAAIAPQLADGRPLPAGAFAYLAEATDNRVTRVVEECAALPADGETAELLSVSPGSPVLVTRTRHFGSDGRAIAFSEDKAPANAWHTISYTVVATQ